RGARLRAPRVRHSRGSQTRPTAWRITMADIPLKQGTAMHIAITGATGFLGRYIVRHLAKAGHQLRCWHRPTSDRTGFDGLETAIDWMPGQLGDPEATTALVRRSDAVVHAAVEWAGPRNRRRSAE